MGEIAARDPHALPEGGGPSDDEDDAGEGRRRGEGRRLKRHLRLVAKPFLAAVKVRQAVTRTGSNERETRPRDARGRAVNRRGACRVGRFNLYDRSFISDYKVRLIRSHARRCIIISFQNDASRGVILGSNQSREFTRVVLLGGGGGGAP